MQTLEKSYLMAAEEEGVLEKAVGTKIEWKSGKDVTVKIMKKKPKKGGKDAKPQIKTEKIESFFNFFSPPDVRPKLLAYMERRQHLTSPCPYRCLVRMTRWMRRPWRSCNH